MGLEFRNSAVPHFGSSAIIPTSCRLLQPVTGGLTSDDDVVDVALAQSGARDAHEARFLLQVGDGGAAAVAHAGAQAAHQLLHHGGELSLVGDAALDALGH